MYFSFNKLKQIANLSPSVTVKDVSNAINSIGFEVENIEKFAHVSGIKFGKILEIYKNPQADKLNVCKIKFVDKERIIQTTADNIKVGDIIIAFVHGSKVGDITFGKKELKGIVSEGMLSNVSEFGINKEYLRKELFEGIGIYNGVKLEYDPIEYLGLNDYIIEVDILTNRSDANSYRVMALELSAFFKSKPVLDKYKKATFKSKIRATKGDANSLVFVESRGKINISLSDQILLAKHKIKSVNDLSDLSNLVLIFTGQPTHAYDKNVVGNSFTCKKYTGSLEVFGNKKVELKDNLVIMSDKKPICIASTIGLEIAKTSQDSTDAIFELGIFPTKEIRDNAKATKMNTNSSNQGSKKIAIGTTQEALIYLSNRLKDFSEPINLPPNKTADIPYSEELLFKIVGKDLSKDKQYISAIESLKILGFIFMATKVKIPSYRHDIKSQQDMNEEVLRFYGYDNLEEQDIIIHPFKISKTLDYKTPLATDGYMEVRTYTLTSEKENIINPFEFKKSISLEIPFTSERSVIRNSQAISLQEIANYNFKRKMTDLNIFSEGMIGDGIKTMAFFSNTKSFRDMQQDIVNLIGNVTFKRAKKKCLHPNMYADIFKGKKHIGWIGKLHPSCAKVDGITVEFIKEDYSILKKAKEYNTDPLKVSDHNIILKKHEDLGKHLELFKDAQNIKVVDEYQDKDNLKITIRVKK